MAHITPDNDSAARIRNILPQDQQFRAESIGKELAGYQQAHQRGTDAAYQALQAANATFNKGNAGIYGLGSPNATKDQLSTMSHVYSCEATHHESHQLLPAVACKKSREK